MLLLLLAEIKGHGNVDGAVVGGGFALSGCNPNACINLVVFVVLPFITGANAINLQT